MTQQHFAKLRNRNESCTLWQHCPQEIIVHGSVCKSCSGTWSSESRAWTTKVTMRKMLEWIGHESPLRTCFTAIKRCSAFPFPCHHRQSRRKGLGTYALSNLRQDVNVYKNYLHLFFTADIFYIFTISHLCLIPTFIKNPGNKTCLTYWQREP